MIGARRVDARVLKPSEVDLAMNIVVLVKQVPDSGSERRLDPADNTVARASADNVINEMDEYAIEEALLVRDREGGEVTVLTVGPDTATDAIRKALSMGADKAVHVSDEAIHGSDAVQTSAVLAAALGQLEFDLILCGAEATDAQMSVMPALLAERLGIPQLSGARKLTLEGGVAREPQSGVQPDRAGPDLLVDRVRAQRTRSVMRRSTLAARSSDEHSARWSRTRRWMKEYSPRPVRAST